MPRARNIKPGFFTNDSLVDLPFEVRLLFIGLWTVADKKGRMADRPKKIKMEIFPNDDLNVDQALNLLQEKGFLKRYISRDVACIQIVNWAKHQNPHIKEADSVLPEETSLIQELAIQAQEMPVQAPAGTVQESEKPVVAVLIPDSLIPEYGFSTPLISNSIKTNPVAPACGRAIAKPTGAKKATAGTGKAWVAYSEAYLHRYGIEPIRNAQVNGMLSNLVARIGAEEAPHVASFFVGHNNAFYVNKGHAVKLLLADCEKLRTEWATNRQITQGNARQIDKTATNYSVWAPMIAEAEAREAAEALAVAGQA